MKHRTSRAPAARLAAALAIASATVPARAATYTYGTVDGTATELWSTGTGWDATPVGATDTVLVFGGSFASGAAPVSENDFAGAFTLNTLTLGGTGPDSATASLTIAGNPLRFAGTAPVVNLNANRGGGTSPALTWFIAAPLELADDTLFTGAGNATFQLDGEICGPGGLHKGGGSGLRLGAANSFTGPTVINAGTVTLVNNALASSSSVTVNATLARSVAVTLNNLSGTGNLTASTTSAPLTLHNTLDTSFAGTLDSVWNGGNNNVSKLGPGSFAQQGLWYSKNNTFAVYAGEHVLSGGGRMSISYNTPGRFYQGATFTLDNSSENRTDRTSFNQSQSGGGEGSGIILYGATLRFIGNGSADSSQQLGSLTYKLKAAVEFAAGSSTVEIVPGAGRSAVLSYTSNQSGVNANVALRRNAGATVLFKGVALGSAASSSLTPDTANFVYRGGVSTFAPTLTGGVGPGIIKGVIVNNVSGDSEVYGLATYDPGADAANATADDVGIRPLAAGELSGALGAELNVRATSALTNDGSAINALHLDTGGSIADGTTALTVSSGTILSTGAANAIGGTVGNDTLAFGSGEGIFYNGPDSTLTVNMKVTGSGGLTKGGNGTLVLKATSGTGQYTGTTYVNGGVLSIDGNSALGAVATGSGVNLNNGGVLRATATFTLDNAGSNRRALAVGGTTANTLTSGGIDVVAGEALTVSGVISGVGRLDKSGAGALTLTANNTWSGGTTVAGGRLEINGNTSNHGNVEVQNGGTLAGTWGTSKTLTLATGKTLTVASGGTLEIDAGNAPRTVTGNLNLAASGDILAIVGTVSDEVLLTYTGTLTGAFDTVTGLPGGYRLDYATPGQVRLEKQRGSVITIR